MVKRVKFVVMSPLSHIIYFKMSFLLGYDVIWGPQRWTKLNNEELFGAEQSREKSRSIGKFSTEVNWTV